MHRKIQALALAGVLCILVLLYGCDRKVVQYSYNQTYPNVVKIEVFRYNYGSKSDEDATTLITMLDLEKGKALLKDIAELPCYKHWGDFPLGSYGDIILYITYANGEAEVVGNVNSASVNTNGEWYIKGYYFDNKPWSEVLTKYIDKELVPELDKYL